MVKVYILCTYWEWKTISFSVLVFSEPLNCQFCHMSNQDFDLNIANWFVIISFYRLCPSYQVL